MSEKLVQRFDELEEEIANLQTRLNGVERELGQLATNFEKRLEVLEMRRAGKPRIEE